MLPWQIRTAGLQSQQHLKCVSLSTAVRAASQEDRREERQGSKVNNILNLFHFRRQ